MVESGQASPPQLLPTPTVPAPDFEGWTCPLPLRDSPQIVMGHGGGGAMTAELIEHLFLPALANERPDRLGDSAVLDLGGARIAFSTDSFVVRPLFFPGGSIGDLAVNGTVNDLAMSGAQPAYLSAGFILEEGTDVAAPSRSATASSSTRPASAWCPRACTSGRTAPRWATRSSSAATSVSTVSRS